MKYGIDFVSRKRVEAKAGLRAYCPCCNERLLAKCGNIYSHHWAHMINSKCDLWWEGETIWHRNWKNKFPDDWQEKIIKKNNIVHIADVFNEKRNLIIEFQNSPISIDDIHEREFFYNRMIWVINGVHLKIEIQDLDEYCDYNIKKLRNRYRDQLKQRNVLLKSESDKILNHLYSLSKEEKDKQLSRNGQLLMEMQENYSLGIQSKYLNKLSDFINIEDYKSTTTSASLLAWA